MESDNKNILKFVISDFLSGFGAWISFIGINWFLLEKTGLSSIVGLQMSVYTFAGLIISPFAGIIIDKFNRKRIIMISNYLRIIAMTFVAIILWLGYYNLNLILLLSIVNGAGYTLYTGCSRAFIQQITNKGSIIKTNSWLEVSLQVGSFVAAGISGVVYEKFGIVIILFLNVICFILSNIMLALVKYKENEKSLTQNRWLTSFREGFQYIFQYKDIAIIGFCVFIPLILGSALNVLLPNFISNGLGKRTITYGIVQMGYGIGAAVSGILLGILIKKISKLEKLPIWMFMVTAIIIGCITKVNNSIMLIIIMFIFGMINTFIRAILNTILMERINKDIMGRVMTTLLFITRIFQTIILYVVGVEVDKFPIYIGFYTIAAVSLLGTVGLIIAKKSKNSPDNTIYL